MKNRFHKPEELDREEFCLLIAFVILGIVTVFFITGCSTKRHTITDSSKITLTDSVSRDSSHIAEDRGISTITDRSSSIDSNTVIMDLPQGGQVAISEDGAVSILAPDIKVIKRRVKVKQADTITAIDTTSTTRTESNTVQETARTEEKQTVIKETKRRPSFIIIPIVLIVLLFIGIGISKLKKGWLIP